ncbi:hypothetical protein IQ07DRAFT_686210 [Pyrenochaeta sp. DS3sAY3a]|nr:hypothetical protein IQ07DRAFT_686210 [Pyrenochaeta sp. DS3sAY3a]
MSRKSNDTPSSTRIRDNQRRSRMRRTEHLHSLQERLQEYERQGVAATLKMQRAARKVAQDNVRLRALLALHGVPSEQVESFLRSSDEASTSKAILLSFQGPSTTCQSQALENEGNDFFRPSESSHQTKSHHESHGHTIVEPRLTLATPKNHCAQHVNIPRPSTSSVQTEIPPSDTVAECDDMQGHGEWNDSNYPRPVMEPSKCLTSLDCFCAPPPVDEHHPASSGLEISCEAAATIIVEMRGDGDRDSIRASLGCRGQRTCNVKNSTVLEIIDE